MGLIGTQLCNIRAILVVQATEQLALDGVVVQGRAVDLDLSSNVADVGDVEQRFLVRHLVTTEFVIKRVETIDALRKKIFCESIPCLDTTSRSCNAVRGGVEDGLQDREPLGFFHLLNEESDDLLLFGPVIRTMWSKFVAAKLRLEGAPESNRPFTKMFGIGKVIEMRRLELVIGGKIRNGRGTGRGTGTVSTETEINITGLGWRVLRIVSHDVVGRTIVGRIVFFGFCYNI